MPRATDHPADHDPFIFADLEFALRAYAGGLFPMADSRNGRTAWYSANPRSIIPLDGLRISRSLGRRIRSQPYRITADTDFAAVIHACSQPRPYANDTWISDAIIRVSNGLHAMGFAHSVEAWRDDPHTGQAELVGGLYGMAIGEVFIGESMFSAARDASKICLVYLVDHLRRCGFSLLDTQILNDHMARMGAIEISREAFHERFDSAVEKSSRWYPPRNPMPMPDLVPIPSS